MNSHDAFCTLWGHNYALSETKTTQKTACVFHVCPSQNRFISIDRTIRMSYVTGAANSSRL